MILSLSLVSVVLACVLQHSWQPNLQQHAWASILVIYVWALFSSLEFQLDASANKWKLRRCTRPWRSPKGANINAVSAKNHISLVDFSLDYVWLCVCVFLYLSSTTSTQTICPFNTCHGKATKILPFSIAQQHLFTSLNWTALFSCFVSFLCSHLPRMGASYLTYRSYFLWSS